MHRSPDYGFGGYLARGIGCTARHRPRLPALFAAVLAAWTAWLGPMPLAVAAGLDRDKVIDVAVKALAASGVLPIPPKEVETLSPLISCMADGKPVPTCAKEAVYARILGSKFKDVAPVVECVVSGTPVAECAKRVALSKLPPEAQSLATCANQAAQCLQDAFVARLPPEAQRVIKCVQQGRDEIDCATELARNDPAARKAFEDLRKVTDPINGSKILGIVNAIQNEDWVELAALAGPEAAKIAVCIVIDVLFAPGPHSAIMCQAGASLIDKRVESVRNFIDQMQDKDIGGALGTLAKAGLIDYQCAVLEAFEPDLVGAVCGVLGKVLDAGAREEAVVATFVSIFSANPVLGGLVYLGLKLFSDDKDCGTPAQYYEGNYFACYHRGSYLGLTDVAALDNLSRRKHAACVAHFRQCDKSKAGDICNSLSDQFNRDVRALVATYQKLADGHASGRRSDFEANRSRVCSATEPDKMNADARTGFQMGCEGMLSSVRPVGWEADEACSKPGAQSFTWSQPTAYEAACKKASEGRLRQIIGEVCAGAGQCFPLHQCPAETFYSIAAGKCLPTSNVK